MNESSIRSSMAQVIDLIASDIGSIRGGRATPAIVEDLRVAVYGGQQKLKINELATISTNGPQSILIDPWDKTIIGEIRQGILAANVGLNPNIDGEIIRINLPEVTGEDREKFVKLLNKKLENGRIMIRQIRGDVMHDVKKNFEDKKLSEDEKFNQEKRLQEITDEFIEKIDKIGEAKKQELTQI